MIVEEAAADLRVGDGREAVGARGARCRADYILVDAGDGDGSDLGEDDLLDGGAGRNQLYGRGGADSLVLLLGRLGDHADGGSGDDVLSFPSPRTTIACGGGFDSVDVGAETLVPHDCERVGGGFCTIDLHLELRSTRAAIASASPTRGPLRVRLAGRGRGAREVATRGRRPRLNALGRRLLRRDGRLVVVVSAELIRFRVVLRLAPATSASS